HRSAVRQRDGHRKVRGLSAGCRRLRTSARRQREANGEGEHSDRAGQFRAGLWLMLLHRTCPPAATTPPGRETSPQEASPLIRASGTTAQGMDLLACGSPRVGRLPKDLASVAAGRTLPTHSCATAPDLDRLPAFGELFSYASHYARSETPASSKVAISVSRRTAARTSGRASAAPVPSPSRSSRSSSGRSPSRSSTAAWPSSDDR